MGSYSVESFCDTHMNGGEPISLRHTVSGLEQAWAETSESQRRSGEIRCLDGMKQTICKPSE